MEYLEYGGLIVSVLTVLLGLLFSISWVIAWILSLLAQRNYEKQRNVFLADIHQIGRWCGYEFPVLVDLEAELARQWSRGCSIDPSTFREAIRHKYKKPKEAA